MIQQRMTIAVFLSLVLLAWLTDQAAVAQDQPSEAVLRAEAARTDVVARASAATIAVMGTGGEGGGSGVLISPMSSPNVCHHWFDGLPREMSN